MALCRLGEVSAQQTFAVCSDAEVGKKRDASDEDIVQTFAHELRYPATTDAKRLAYEIAKRHDAQHMSVVYGEGLRRDDGRDNCHSRNAEIAHKKIIR